MVDKILGCMCVASATLLPTYAYWWYSGQLDEWSAFMKAAGISLILSIFALSAATLNDRRKIAARKKGEY